MRFTLLGRVALIGLLASLAEAEPLYVDDDAPLGGNGASWVSAFRYLQDALAVAAAGDEIFVAQGTYKPDQDESGSVTPGDRRATFPLRSGVGLYGGYRGCPGGDCAGGDPGARDTALCVTVLNGDLLGNDGPNFAHNADNSYHVVTANATDNAARFDGFTVTAGNADYEAPDRRGSGLYMTQGALAITNCTFSGNAIWGEGAAVYSTGGSGPVLTGCTISANRAAGFTCEQGAISSLTGCRIVANSSSGVLLDNAQARVVGCTIARNFGAGIECSGDVTITGCIISGNGSSPSVAPFSGGGVFCRSGSLTILDCVISGNQQAGGLGLPWMGGGVLCGWHCELTMINCTVWWNESQYGGGGVACDGCTATLTGCSIAGNWGFAAPDYWGSTWDVDGGGIWASDGASLTLDDCTLAGNYASGNGGGVFASAGCSLTSTGATFGGNLSGIDGGAIQAEYASLALVGCAFTGNRAYGSGGAVHAEGPLTARDCTFDGNASDGNGGALHTSSTGDATTITNCLFAGNLAAKRGGALIGGFLGASAIADCTFAENSSRFGAVYGLGEPLTITNCILWHDTPVEIDPASVVPFIEFSDVTGGWPGSGNADTDPRFTGGPSGTWTAPGVYNWRTYQVTFTDDTASWTDNELVGMLVKPIAYMPYQFSIIANSATTITTWADAWAVLSEDSWEPEDGSYRVCDYRLAADSPCINAGSNYAPALPAVDLTGGPRIQQCRVDMGAYESPHVPATFLDCNHNGVDDDCDVFAGTSADTDQNGVPDECERCAGDLNCDGQLDFADINAFVAYLSNFAQWQSTYRGCDARNGDINGDGSFGQSSFEDISPFVMLLSSRQMPILCPAPDAGR